jgi:hypothetical protein
MFSISAFSRLRPEAGMDWSDLYHSVLRYITFVSLKAAALSIKRQMRAITARV